MNPGHPRLRLRVKQLLKIEGSINKIGFAGTDLNNRQTLPNLPHSFIIAAWRGGIRYHPRHHYRRNSR